MILTSQQIFDKVYLDRDNPSEFIKYVSDSVERELVNKFMNVLEDHKLHAVVLKEPEFIEDLPESSWWPKSAYKQKLVCLTFVQCKNCRMSYPWCQRFRDELGGEGYCPYGKEIEDEFQTQDQSKVNQNSASLWKTDAIQGVLPSVGLSEMRKDKGDKR